MKISVVTPSFRGGQWLKLCIASVADQAGADFEHIVQDACSDDGTQDWLPGDKRVRSFIEKDSGMYDAVNRGFRRASGEVLAYLNCDEQYLPGALQAVTEAFQRRPETDILLADTVVADTAGGFIVCRRSLVPWRLLQWTYSGTITSSIFIHRRVLDHFNLYFDVRFRDLADAFWIREATQMRLNMAVMRRYTSIFTETGENMNLKANAMRERRLMVRMMPAWARHGRWFLLQVHRMRALCHGLYWEKPFSYSLYTLKSPDRRVEVAVPKPTIIWWQRHRDAKMPAPL
jgi:glycosyltransferase involved in cell wall biosynthesis